MSLSIYASMFLAVLCREFDGITSCNGIWDVQAGFFITSGRQDSVMRPIIAYQGEKLSGLEPFIVDGVTL